MQIPFFKHDGSCAKLTLQYNESTGRVRIGKVTLDEDTAAEFLDLLQAPHQAGSFVAIEVDERGGVFNEGPLHNLYRSDEVLVFVATELHAQFLIDAEGQFPRRLRWDGSAWQAEALRSVSNVRRAMLPGAEDRMTGPQLTTTANHYAPLRLLCDRLGVWHNTVLLFSYLRCGAEFVAKMLEVADAPDACVVMLSCLGVQDEQTSPSGTFVAEGVAMRGTRLMVVVQQSLVLVVFERPGHIVLQQTGELTRRLTLTWNGTDATVSSTS